MERESRPGGVVERRDISSTNFFFVVWGRGRKGAAAPCSYEGSNFTWFNACEKAFFDSLRDGRSVTLRTFLAAPGKVIPARDLARVNNFVIACVHEALGRGENVCHRGVAQRAQNRLA